MTTFSPQNMIKTLLRKFVKPAYIRKAKIVIARHFGNNNIIGLQGNQLKADGLLMKGSRIYFYGKNNAIIVGGGTR